MQVFRFNCKNGTTVDIEIDDWFYTIEVFASGRKKIGGMEFQHIQDERDNELKLTWAYLDEAGPTYLGQGIGRECIRLMADVSAMPITAEDNNEMKKDDGSHLTGDAPGFVQKMREEGLIG